MKFKSTISVAPRHRVWLSSFGLHTTLLHIFCCIFLLGYIVGHGQA